MTQEVHDARSTGDLTKLNMICDAYVTLHGPLSVSYMTMSC